MAGSTSFMHGAGLSAGVRLETLSPAAYSSHSSPASLIVSSVSPCARVLAGASRSPCPSSASPSGLSSASQIAGLKLRVDSCGRASCLGDRIDKQARAQAATCEQQTQEKYRTPTMQSRVPCEEGTLYDLLGLNQNVSLKEVKTAYRELARRFHPDVVPPQRREESTKNFLKIHSAYATLCDPARKAAYDLRLSLQRHQAIGYGGYRPAAPKSGNWSYQSVPLSSSWDNRSSASYYSAPSSFSTSSQWKGRRWETDQCW